MAERSLTVMPKELMGVRAAGNYDFDQLYRFAQICHASGLFEDVTDAAQAFVKIAKGQELGIPPTTAMSAFELIRKRLFIKPWAIAAKINACGYGAYRVMEQTPERCAIVFRKKYPGEGWVALPEVTYTYAEAKGLGLVTRSAHWAASPAHMLYQRCMGRGGAMHFPELLAGLEVPQDDAPIADARHAHNILDLFGDGDSAAATGAPARAPSPPPLAGQRAVGDEAVAYMDEIEAAVLAQGGQVEPWYVFAERRAKKTRDQFTVTEWADLLQAVCDTVQKLPRPSAPGAPQGTHGPQELSLQDNTAVSIVEAPGGQKQGIVEEEPFVDPETGEMLTPGVGQGVPSWGPESPNLFAEEEAEEQAHG